MTRPAREVVAVVAAGGVAGGDQGGTIASLRRAHPSLTVLAGTAAGALAEADGRCHLLVVTAPAAFPPGALDAALPIVEDDMGVATVSFLNDGGGFLHLDAGGLDEETVTRRLRSRAPALEPAPVPFAAGPAVLLSAFALSATGPPPQPDHLSLAAFSLRARRRGFRDVVDPSTFLRARAAAAEPGAEPWAAEAQALGREVAGPGSALAVVLAAARAKVMGLRVLVDGSCLGPWEMGTQVQTVALVGALARRPDVERVVVAVPGAVAELAPYAAALLSHPKVEARTTPGGDLTGLGPVDVAHQPFQPDGPVEIADWSAPGGEAARSALTLLDLIAYHGRSYQVSDRHWAAYRARLRRAAARVDGVVAPSRDVARQIRAERLAVDDRLFVVPLGADHVAGDEVGSPPAALAAALAGSGAPFLLVLGADYTHKNRDLAVRAVHELRRRGRPCQLVLAGPGVHGSSREEEAAAGVAAEGIHVVGEVPSGERNWLLRHASAVLYPTSAEGFGLVPFEAARFGTPTVLVPLGPLAETFGDLPVTAADWSPSSLADATDALLADPALAASQVRAALTTGSRYGWDASAAGLVDVYRTLLSRPPRAPDPAPAPPPHAPEAPAEPRRGGLLRSLRRRPPGT